MRRLVHIAVAALITVLVAGVTAPGAMAGILDPDLTQSNMSIQIGGLPPIGVDAQNTNATLASNGDVILAASVWSTINKSPGTALFTGVPLIDDLRVTVANAAATYQIGHTAVNPIAAPFTYTTPSGATGMYDGVLRGGGVAGLNGQSVIIVGPTGIPIGLSVVGAGGTATATALGAPVTVTGAPWATNHVQITGIMSNLLTITNGPRMGVTGIAFTLVATDNENTIEQTFEFGMQVITLTATRAGVTGSRNTGASSGGAQTGMITMVSPMRILTGLGFQLPGVARQEMSFVPEPTAIALAAAGVAGLVTIGISRRRRK